MNSSTNPILIEMSKQLPGSIQTFKDIQEPKSYTEIFAQARKEILCLRDMKRHMDDGQSARAFMQQSGYQFLLDNTEEEDEQEERLRLLGTLQLIAELAQELAEE